ncbi:MAG: OprO/OprP family phosphate-selective porin [Chitinophagales bacterium]|nr:OprO/OprP family phosphate-selective porin [Chitinophagales bacterium]
MKKLFLSVTIILLISYGVFAQSNTSTGSTFNPAIKVKGLIHTRYEQSFTDSVDVQGKFNADPVQSNFRIRRLELRADITLNEHWSGVIRIQIPDFKTSTPGKAMELAYFEYKYNDQFKVRGGQFKAPMELDELTSHEDLRMIDRGTLSKLWLNNYYTSYQPGLMVFGTFLKDKTPLSYYAGVFNGSDRGVAYDINSQKNFAGRLEFTPVKGLRLAVNGQTAGIDKGITGGTAGADISFIHDLSSKLNLIVEGEYISGTNVVNYSSSTDTAKELNNFKMAGYFGQALLRIKLEKPWCKTFEIGGKYENTDPSNFNENDAYSTITGGIGLIFLPDNDARLQLNVVQTNYEKEIAGSQKNNTMFVAQLQLKI